jgi:hypothetical protein
MSSNTLPPSSPEMVLNCWVLGQKQYFENKLLMLKKQQSQIKLCKYLLLFLALVNTEQTFAQVINFESSPYNMQNSPYNMDNSPYNMRNSPYNMDNSPYNTNSTNGVYDNTGNRIGYEVKAPSGVTNYFDNSGNRIGYTPAKQ